jgi:hypothetical protein
MFNVFWNFIYTGTPYALHRKVNQRNFGTGMSTRLAMEIQYRCQQFFFGEMAYNYFADQNKEFVVRKRSTRYEECFRKLPEEFKTQQFTEVFGCSQQAASRAITRFRNDGVIEVVKYGVYKKVVSELP